MPTLLLELVVLLFVILVAAEIFTNALEHLGEKLKISEGVTGSLFAAVGTALPETLIPLLALFAGTAHAQVNEEIGVGAILGAPLMLSTLSTGLVGFAVLKHRGFTGHVRPEHSGLMRDLNFFIVAFVLACIAMYVPQQASLVRGAIGFSLVLIYFFYILLTLKASAKLVADGHNTEAGGDLFLSKIGLPTHIVTITAQMILGLGLLVAGAKGFIYSVEHVAAWLGISALLLSLLIIPIATELPEKINSILWIRRGKDTLAFGNITGAMVFQGTLLPAIGITLTPWQPRIEVLTGVFITLIAATWLRLKARMGGFPVWILLVNSVLYLTYLIITLWR